VKIVVAVHVAILAVCVVLKATQDNGSAGAATGSGAEGVVKSGSLTSQLIQIRCLNHWVAIAAGILALIVDDKENDVLWGSLENRAQQAE